MAKSINSKLFIGFLSFSLLTWIIGYFAITMSSDALRSSIIAHHLDLDSKYIEIIYHYMHDKADVFDDYSKSFYLQDAVNKSNAEYDNISNRDEYIEKIDAAWKQTPLETITPFMEKLINDRLSMELRIKIEHAKAIHNHYVYSEVFITNKYGVNIAMTNKTSDFLQSDERWWQITKKNGFFIGKPEFDESSKVNSIPVGIAIKSNEGVFIGAIKVILYLEALADILNEMKQDESHEQYDLWSYGIVTSDGTIVYSKGKFDIPQDIMKYLSLHEHTYVIKKDEKLGDLFSTYVKHKGDTGLEDIGWILVNEHSVSEIFSQINRLKNSILSILIFLTICAIALSYYFSRKISKPLTMLTQSINKFSISDLNTQIKHIDTEDEVGQLSKAFQNMAVHLRNNFSEIERINKGLSDKIESGTGEIKKNYELQNVISSVLKLSFKSLTLNEFLDLSLDILFSVPWFAARSVGCIFLFDEEAGTLKMVARRNFPKELLEPCKEVPVGTCLCGMAALKKEIVYKCCVDGEHEIQYENMPSHGHYCVPIIIKDRVLGIINVDIDDSHKKDKLEEQLLLLFADTIASVIERKKVDEKLVYIANYDPLTGLPNRTLFFDRLTQSVQHSKRYNNKTAVLYLDLDKFKSINDTYGHDVGDLVLKKTSARLKKCIRDIDTVARLGGDEFAIIIYSIGERDELGYVCNRILKELGRPVEYKEKSFSIIVSIGISIYPDDGSDSALLLKKADVAMYNAKASFGSKYLFYSSEMDKHLKERDKLEEDIRYAITNNEFILYYQPQIDLQTGKVTGAEALIRWNHPIFGMVYPDKFIPIAEESGLIVDMGNWVIKTSCEQMISWKKMGIELSNIAVNVASTQFQQYDFVDTVLTILSQTLMDPKFLELEITERISIQDIDTTIDVLNRFNSLGIKVSIDDFGTGYSSLSYLKRLPFNKIKIDRSFIMDIEHNQDALTIAKTIIDMAHNLKIPVIAEGVETQEQLDILKNLNCNEAQGYFFSKPIDPDNFVEYVKSHP